MPTKNLSAATIKPSTSAMPKSSTSSATGGSVFQSYQAGAGIQNNNNAATVGAGIVAGEYNPATPATTTESAGQPVTSTATTQTGPATVLNPLNWNWGTGKKWLVIGGAALVIGMIVYFVYFRKKK
jgi:hypothetical protein